VYRSVVVTTTSFSTVPIKQVTSLVGRLFMIDEVNAAIVLVIQKACADDIIKVLREEEFQISISEIAKLLKLKSKFFSKPN